MPTPQTQPTEISEWLDTIFLTAKERAHETSVAWLQRSIRELLYKFVGLGASASHCSTSGRIIFFPALERAHLTVLFEPIKLLADLVAIANLDDGRTAWAPGPSVTSSYRKEEASPSALKTPLCSGIGPIRPGG